MIKKGMFSKREKTDTFIFDLNGVILDTHRCHYLSWKTLCDELDMELSVSDFELIRELPQTEALATILSMNRRQADHEEMENYLAMKDRSFIDHMSELTEEHIRPGVRNFLARSAEHGFRTILNGSSQFSEAALEKLKLDNCFDLICLEQKDSASFPYSGLIRNMETDPGNCIVFTDSVKGTIASHRAAMKTVGVYNSRIRDHCDYFIESLGDIEPKILIKKVAGE